MKVIESPLEMRKISERLRAEGKKIGFVPTMGALHEGHLSLVRQAKEENEIAVASIFVNPIQFGPKEDLARYPRTFDADRIKLESENCDYLFFPSVETMYDEGFQTYIDLKELPNHLCGLSREGHFRGVATVVAKLLNIVFPDTAYFGQKDYQQAQIIRRMCRDLNFFVEIKMMPIVREKDGLALSSRNQYLNSQERIDAVVLHESLELASELFKHGEKNSQEIISKMKSKIGDKVSYAKLDYINIVDPNTLKDREIAKKGDVVAIAVFFGKTRLIDNTIL